MARFIGFTSHSNPAQAARALAEHDVDVIMVPVNYGDQHTYGFERQVLPVAHAHDVGIAAMKVYGGATDMKYETLRQPAALTAKGPVDHEPAMRWALEQAGVAIAVIGMFIHTELEQNVRWAHRMHGRSPPTSGGCSTTRARRWPSPGASASVRRSRRGRRGPAGRRVAPGGEHGRGARGAGAGMTGK